MLQIGAEKLIWANSTTLGDVVSGGEASSVCTASNGNSSEV